jgi:group I intron endonuclease
MNDCGVYQIEHLASGKKFVGSAVRVRRRLSKHKTDLRGGYHHSQKLQRAWAKYGEDAFVFTVLEEVPDEARLLVREQHWIDKLGTLTNGFNICPVAGSCRGRELTPEHRARLSASLKGRKRPPEDHASLLGTARSAETRARISAAKRGRPISAETLAQRSASMRKAWATRRANQAAIT